MFLSTPRFRILIACRRYGFGCGSHVRGLALTASGQDERLAREVGQPAVHLGLSLLQGMREEAARRIEDARAVRPFVSVTDLARRAALDRDDIEAAQQTLAAS